LAGKNEAPKIEFCIRALSMYCDSIVYLDDNSEDESLSLVEALSQECNVEHIIRKTDNLFHETIRRAQTLAAGRALGGTHFVVIDVDEAFTANCLDHAFLRRKILDLSPGDSLEVPYFELWRSVKHYRDDQSIWGNKSMIIAFADDGMSTYPEKFIHLHNMPSGLKGQRHRLETREHGLMHFQFVNWRNLLVKQSWYRCLERINDPSKSVKAINALYAPTKDETGVRLSSVPDAWMRQYPFFDERRLHETETWRERQILGWFEDFGVAYFQDLDIWDVEWGTALGHSPVPVPDNVQRQRYVERMVTKTEHLHATGHFAEAERQLTHLLDDHVEHWLVPNNLGVLRASVGHYLEAESLLQRARALDPYQPEAALNLARLYQARGWLNEAISLLIEFVSQHPNSPFARNSVQALLDELQ